MKKHYLASLILPAILLSSCTLLASTKTYEKEIAVYDLDKIDENGKIESGLQTTLNTRYIGGREYLPYITFEQYVSLYEPHLAEDAVSEIKKSRYGISWTITIGESLYFATEIDYYSRQIIIAGDLEATYADDDDPRDLKALDYAMGSKAEGKFLSDRNYGLYSYRDAKISSFTYGGDTYFPLSFLDITYSYNSAIYFTYNYAHIFSTRDVDNYNTFLYEDDGVQWTFESQMSGNKKHEFIPSYLVEYNANLFVYLMDNFYGLKDYYNITSMASFYKNTGIYHNLFSSLDGNRGQAYLDALTILDDNHTTLYSVAPVWNETDLSGRRYGKGITARSQLRSQLREMRRDVYGRYQENGAKKIVHPEEDILYSSDGKSAMFAFDSFVFGTSEDVFNPDGTIKETAKSSDTFIKILHILTTIKNKGGVENVILDISINGGGVVGVMMKLLALLSKDNKGHLTFYDDKTTQASIYTCFVDSNQDGEYDAKDCFGNDFNFYILTSDCSFSCGNAFPALAQIVGDAKIIGQKSGGGECAVAIHYLPNSQYVYHSSNLHLGFYDEAKDEFIGFEKGVTPDITLDINEDFYSIDALNNAIKNAN